MGVARVEAFEAVLPAAQAGAAWVARALWEALSVPVAGYLRSGGALEPEDLTSEVFLAVFEHLPQFRGDEPAFRAFVFTIAHRRLMDDLRRRYRRPDLVPWVAGEDKRDVASAEDEALSSLGSARTRALLEALAPDQRDVLVLRIFADLTVEQVAEVLGKRPGAVKALQRRGLAALRKTILSEGVPLQAGPAMTEVR